MKFDTLCLLALAVLIMASCHTNQSRMKDYEFLRGPVYGQTTSDKNAATITKPHKSKFLSLKTKRTAKYKPAKMAHTFKGLIMPASASKNAATNRAIAAGDQLRIRVYREDDLSNIFSVNETGAIDYPLIGSVSVQNLTPAQIGETLKTKLKGDYLINPNIMVDRVQFCTALRG